MAETKLPRFKFVINVIGNMVASITVTPERSGITNRLTFSSAESSGLMDIIRKLSMKNVDNISTRFGNKNNLGSLLGVKWEDDK